MAVKSEIRQQPNSQKKREESKSKKRDEDKLKKLQRKTRLSIAWCACFILCDHTTVTTSARTGFISSTEPFLQA